MNPKRDEFFQDLCTDDIDAIEKKYLHKFWVKRLMVLSKPLLYKMGVFSMYLWVKKHHR